MISTFHGIEVGKRGLQVHQQGMHVVEHNVSNAGTEGYSRQRITFETFDPLYIPGLSREQRPGQVGMGTVVQRIERVRNAFIDDRIMAETSNQGYWNTMQFNLSQVQNIHSEPSAHTLRSNLDNFWKSWQNLNNDPKSRAAREVLQKNAVGLSQNVAHTFDRLNILRNNVDNQIRIKVKEINALAKQISEINEQILKSKQVGDMPNDMLDRRDKMVEKLAKMVNVNVVRKDPDEFFIYVGSQYLVQGAKYRKMKAEGNARQGGLADVRWNDDNRPVKMQSGELKALMVMRDDVLYKQITQLDNLAANIMDLVNSVHRDGFGLNFKTGLDFFRKVPLTQNRNGNYDSTGNGVEDKTILFRIFGTKKLDKDAQIGSAGQLNFGPLVPGGKDAVVNYSARDRVDDVIKRINRSGVGVVAYINHRGRLGLKASVPEDKRQMRFVIRHLQDSGDFLVGISGLLRQRGAQGAYDWNAINQVNKLVGGEKDYSVTPQYHPSRWMTVDQAILRDINSIAAAKGTDTTGDDRFDKSNGVGDGSNALKISSFRNADVMIGKFSHFNDYFNSVIGGIGSQTKEAKDLFSKSELVMKGLKDDRKSISGVKMDDELAQMVMFQHGYNASARLIKTFDQMLDTVINRLKA